MTTKQEHSSTTSQPPGDPTHVITLPPSSGASRLAAMHATRSVLASTTSVRPCTSKAAKGRWQEMTTWSTSNSTTTIVTSPTFANSSKQETKAHWPKPSPSIVALCCKASPSATPPYSKSGCVTKKAN